MDNLLYFIILALLAEIVGTIGGFGSSLFFIPIASFFLDFYSVLGITGLFHITSNLSKIGFFHKGFDKKLIIQLGIPAVIFVIIGAVLSNYVATFWLEIVLAIFLILLSVSFLFFKKLQLKPTSLNTFLGGIFSGFFAGIIGTGGAIRGLTLSAFNLPIPTFIATSAVIDLAVDSGRTVVYGMNGFIHKDDLYLIPILFLVSLVGTFIGKLIVQKISEEHFKKIVLLMILATGIITLVRIV